MTSARLGNVVLATALTMALLPASVIVAQGSPLSDAEADALIADIEAQVAEAEAALEELGSVRMDAGAVIEAVGSDPEAIADWVAQGTRDTLIEAELLGSEAQPNLWRRFIDAAEVGEEWLVIDEVADVDANADSIPPGVRARIRRSLDDGHVVALAPSPSELAGSSYSDLWQVAPDGTTLGIGFRGWGQELGERIGIRGGDSIASASARNQAIQICQRFGVAATAMNVHLIQLELHASRGLRPPRPPADATARYRCPVTPGYPKVPSERLA